MVISLNCCMTVMLCIKMSLLKSKSVFRNKKLLDKTRPLNAAKSRGYII